MSSNKVLLTTVFSGYNYGSSLQALAGKTILKELGYDCQLVAMKSLVKGRDIRLKKLLTILVRSLMLRGKNGSKSLSIYQNSYNKTMIGDSASLFIRFSDEYLQPNYLSWDGMKKAAKEAVACFAGSDQIWNSSTMYVDPMYYLRFAPAEKRVALAPSFGRDFVADYNKEKIGKWISEFAYLSVREDSGVKLIKEMTGREAILLVDPTLMVDGETWKNILGIDDKESNYILAYFLDKPSELARKAITELRAALKYEVIAIPYQFDDMSYCDKMVSSGTIEFLDLINNAKCVLTDSFHGTAFSINLHTPFYVFSRAYGTAHSQNSRVESILKKVKMQARFEPKDVLVQYDQIDFAYSESVLIEERKNAREYISNALKTIE
ncbi:polysaccharide pyruvyl transferase family protein [Bacteroides xylanisolvens]|uniref:polysaccharide pyruvyl transferase family protein n=1 Tax=Bacteroides xylanisolvens TaxID=371601 RepID=UPI001C01C0AD|nr:polysaccharide pyruvyl transferase family protein [Bacteroides xylanisolvens]MBT9889880.1 polysaccharide pyruvyl transferase family protein [Bacteroides xylanisolvens]